MTPVPIWRRDLLLVLLVSVAYANAPGGAFVFDDLHMVVHNERVHSLAAWIAGVRSGIRPLLNLGYTLNWIADPGPLGFHLVNVVLHAANAVLVHRLGLALAAPPGAALVMALLFGLHPIQTEAVTYVTGRSTSQMAFFWLASFLTYVHGRDRGLRWRIGSAILFALAMATKEIAITLPAALLLYEAATGPAGGWRRALGRQAPHLVVLGALVAALAASPRYRAFAAQSVGLRDVEANLRAQLPALGYLLSRIALLTQPSIDPGLPLAPHWTPRLAGAAIALLALVAVCIRMVRRAPVTAFAVLWFFLLLLPTNSIVPRADVVNERQVYLAVVGPFFLLARGLTALPARATALAAAALVIVLGAATIARNHDYRSEVALWQQTARSSPQNARAFNNLGRAYQNGGCLDDAAAAYRTALQLRPDYPIARANLESVAVERAFAIRDVGRCQHASAS